MSSAEEMASDRLPASDRQLHHESDNFSAVSQPPDRPNTSEASADQFNSEGRVLKRNKKNRAPASIASTSTVPVIVRTYDQRERPHTSSGPPASNMAPRARNQARFPSMDQFSFDKILQTVEPNIHEAIDAIAEICAKSKLSSADSYGAHLPPQGEITSDTQRVYPGRSIGRTLTAVSEASSSAERLAGLDGNTAVNSAKNSKSISPPGMDSKNARMLPSRTFSDPVLQSPRMLSVAAGWAIKNRTPIVDVTITEAIATASSASDSIASGSTADAPRGSRGPAAASWLRWPLQASREPKGLPRDAKAALGAFSMQQTT